ncbi:ras family-domain-containing protein [Cantharellus anzutake]|uniref:ras family-domain-containing protein n=1 Tax=Cantharellus anzutake TaxID=1750568 RepID=UPI001903A17F|nr:ras family-domain-containing protein [Cantharellus anzutake]KAF8339205.1 ras family-domain-containing protein [Cantharellus anzutake]
MDQWRLTILGEGAVGKTALAVQFSMNAFIESYDPTIEDSYRKTILVDNRQAFLEIIDTAGQDEYATLRDQWVREGQGFMLVYSVASRKSFNRLHEFYKAIIDGKQPPRSAASLGQRFARPGIVIIGNKIDIQDERVVTTEEGERLAREWRCGFIETSAKLAVSVDESFCELIRQCRKAGPVDGLPPQLRGPAFPRGPNAPTTAAPVPRQPPSANPNPTSSPPTKPTIRSRKKKKKDKDKEDRQPGCIIM